MRKSPEGFILYMTLCIILIITLLGMTCMQQAFFYRKAIIMQEEQHQDFYNLEALILKIAQQSIKNACLDPGNSPNQVIRRLTQNEGCLLKEGNNEYRYFIQDLGTFPCIVVSNSEKKFSTHHLRISLLSLVNEKHTANRLLQIRFIQPDASLTCEINEHAVRAGIASWRYLSALETLMPIYN